MDILVINLERAKKRRAFKENRLRQLVAKYEIFPGVDAMGDLPTKFNRYDAEACMSRFGAALTPGELGCYASHYLVWEECARRGKPVLVMEDGVELSSAFPDALELASERIAEHRFIRLCGLFPRPFRSIEAINATRQLVRFLRGPSGLQCYALSPDGAQALLAKARSWVEPVDTYVDRFWCHGLTPTALVPFEVRHHDDATLPSLIGERKQHRRGVGKARREFFRLWDSFRRISYNQKLILTDR